MHLSQWRRIGRTLAVPALIVVAVALVPLTQPSSGPAGAEAWTPMTPVA